MIKNLLPYIFGILLISFAFEVSSLFKESIEPVFKCGYSTLSFLFILAPWLLLFEYSLIRLKQKFDKKTIFLICLFLYLLFFFGIIDTKKSLYYAFLFAFIIFSLSTVYKKPDQYIDKLKPYINNLVLLFISIFFSLIFIEFYLHILKPHFLQANYSIVGEFTDFTSMGYLDEKKVFNKENRTFRILGLGDSFADNLVELDKNYLNFLQNTFDTAYGTKKVEVINAGISCVGPGYYLHILEKYGDLLRPDLVLVGFFVGNDFRELVFDRVVVGPYIYEPRDARKRILGYLKFKNFWLYQFLRNKYIEICESKKINKEFKKGIVKKRGYFSKETFFKVERERASIYEKYKNDLENLWKQNSAIMLNIKKWCDKKNINLIIAILPDQFQVEEDLRKEICKQYNLQEDSIDLHRPNKLLLNFCKKAGMHCVDLLEQFQEIAKSNDLYLIRDTHWNEEGNKLAARIIFDYIKMNKLANINKI